MMILAGVFKIIIASVVKQAQSLMALVSAKDLIEDDLAIVFLSYPVLFIDSGMAFIGG